MTSITERRITMFNQRAARRRALVKKITEMHENGATYAEIAAETGVSESTIRTLFKLT